MRYLNYLKGYLVQWFYMDHLTGCEFNHHDFYFLIKISRRQPFVQRELLKVTSGQDINIFLKHKLKIPAHKNHNLLDLNRTRNVTVNLFVEWIYENFKQIFFGSKLVTTKCIFAKRGFDSYHFEPDERQTRWQQFSQTCDHEIMLCYTNILTLRMWLWYSIFWRRLWRFSFAHLERTH